MRHNKFVISNFCTHLRSTPDSTVESSSESSLQSNKDIAKSENSGNDVNSYPTIKSNEEEESIYQAQGLFAVYKPLEWTSQDVVSYVRGMLERDARSRGLKVEKLRKRGNKKRQFKVGHGGTLDPLATGVLVIGVGQGTKQLQDYLNGAKKYKASVLFGFETNTLDMEGEKTREATYTHITTESIQSTLPSFTGKIMQVPPAFSALKKDGKTMYKEARKGKTAEDLGIPPREVEVYSLEYIPTDEKGESFPPSFGLNVSCGKGTYIRSLVRDIGQSLDSAATMSGLIRTQQGPFELEHCLHRDDWSPDNIYAAIKNANENILSSS